MITFQLNGAPAQIAHEGKTLLQVLRDDLHLSGASLAVVKANAGPARLWWMGGQSVPAL